MDHGQQVLLGIVEGPLHVDEWQPGGYVCSFEYTDMTGPPGERRLFSEAIDLYVHDGDCLTLRFGTGDSDYYSSRICSLFNLSQHEPYRSALAIMTAMGRFTWTMREESDG